MRACFSTPPRTLTALVAFGRYYAGLVVLLHSLFHHNAAEPDCGGLLVLWHPVLTPRPGAFVLYVRATRTNLSCVLYEPGAQGSLPRYCRGTHRVPWHPRWHPSLPETVLTEAQRAELACLAGSRRIEHVRVDDGRAATWLRVPTKCNCSEASASLLKLELFYMQR